MISKFIEDTNKKLVELNKIIQNMNDKFTKQLQSMKSHQTEISEIKYPIESMGRNDQCEDRVS